MFKVIKTFKDAQDNHLYHVGDEFPHNGAIVDEKRIKELASKKNRRGMALIEEIKEEAETVKEEPKQPRKRGKKNAE